MSEAKNNLPATNKADKDEMALKNMLNAVKLAEAATELAIRLKDTKFAKNFETVDDDNNPTINVDDITAAIMFGIELGITPMKALSLGNQLNKHSYFSIARGRNMGLDEITALNNIHVFSAANGKVNVYTGVHIISKVLDDARIKREWVHDYTIVYKYYNYTTKEEYNADEVEDSNSNYFIVTAATKPEHITKALAEKKVLVSRKQDRVTSCIFHRDGFSPVHIKYYLSDAVEARLYRGIRSDGESVDGKDNWNNNPRRLMRNRVIITGGREVASDRLYDTYLADEITSIYPNAVVEDVEHETIN